MQASGKLLGTSSSQELQDISILTDFILQRRKHLSRRLIQEALELGSVYLKMESVNGWIMSPQIRKLKS